MWTIRGSTVGDVTEPNASVNILNFRASQYVSEADFNNLSNQFGIVYARTSSISDYTATGSHSGNLLAYNRFNILHPKKDGWEYDGCYYTWLYETVGSDDYKFKAYRLNNLTYSYSVMVTARLTQGDLQLTVPKSRIKSAYLIATEDSNTSSGIGVCRILWHADMSFNGNFSQYPDQWWLGPAIPQSTIEEWLKKIKEDDDDQPEKPDPNPGDEQDVRTEGGTITDWENKFKIMIWPDDGPWPDMTLLDLWTDYPNDHITQHLEEISAFNSTTDPTAAYHLFNIPIYNPSASQVFQKAKNINESFAELGSSIWRYWSQDNTTGYFVSGYYEVDQDDYNTSYYKNFQSSTPANNIDKIICENGFIINNIITDPQIPALDNITLEIAGNTFNVKDNYANVASNKWWNIPSYQGSIFSMLIKRKDPITGKNHYYIGGPIRISYNSTYSSGFGIICRIDDLEDLPGYGGTDPNDPTDPGLNSDDMDDGFDPGNTPNPTTDKETNDNIGDSPDNDGSSKDENGNDRDPANNDTPGTGEKNTNPVNSNTVPNSHDGSMGNGTGDPHQGDSEITDPSTTMPTTAGDEGTVTGSGVLSVFTPTQAELTAFTSELLSSTVLDSIKNFFTTNPMDGIFSLHILPYTGFAGAATAAPRIGTHTFTATMTMAANEFITVDYGTVFVPFVYDGYENFAPNSDVKIFLPFIGTKDIDINVIQGCQCTLKYNVSLVTGDIYAYMYCKWAAKWGDADNGRGVDHLVYSWQGNCAATVPLSHLDSTNYISGAMQTAGGITSLVAGTATGNPFAIPSGIAGVTQGVAEMGRTSIITSGNISGMAAFMGCREPFFIFSRPIIAFNSHYNHYLGQRSNAIETIGSLRDGTFTMMRNVDLTGVSATSAELSEIEAILKGGFYI